MVLHHVVFGQPLLRFPVGVHLRATFGIESCGIRRTWPTFLSFALLWSMAPLFGTHTKNTTVIKLRRCSVELQGLSKVGIQDILVFLICLMCWGGCLFLKEDRRIDLFCFTKLLTVWHTWSSKASLLRRIRVLEENTT